MGPVCGSAEAVAGLLREYECYCYQVAYYLLHDEKAAMEASSRALLDLAEDTVFARLNCPDRRERAKRTTVSHSLHIRKNAVQAG